MNIKKFFTSNYNILLLSMLLRLFMSTVSVRPNISVKRLLSYSKHRKKYQAIFISEVHKYSSMTWTPTLLNWDSKQIFTHSLILSNHAWTATKDWLQNKSSTTKTTMKAFYDHQLDIQNLQQILLYILLLFDKYGPDSPDESPLRAQWLNENSPTYTAHCEISEYGQEVLPSPSSCHLPHVIPISWQTRCWGKERDFIQEASRLRRWWTHILKNHLNLELISSFFYIREAGRQRGLRLGGNNWFRHLYLSTRRIVKLLVLG